MRGTSQMPNDKQNYRPSYVTHEYLGNVTVIVTATHHFNKILLITHSLFSKAVSHIMIRLQWASQNVSL